MGDDDVLFHDGAPTQACRDRFDRAYRACIARQFPNVDPALLLGMREDGTYVGHCAACAATRDT